MVDHQPARRPASRRVADEIRRTGEWRFGSWTSVAIGLVLAVAALIPMAWIDGVVPGSSPYMILMAASVMAAWLGGLPAGVVATVVMSVLSGILLVEPVGTLIPSDEAEAVRQVLYLGVGLATVTLVARRRASSDRLADVLTEMSTLAEQLTSRDDRLEIVLSASRTGLWEWDIIGGSLSWTDAIYRQHGLDPDGPAPDFPTYLETIHPEDRAAFQEAISSAMESDQPFDVEFRVVWPDGSIHWTRSSGRPFRDANGRPIWMIGTGQDITQRKRLEAERDVFVAAERRAGEFREAFIDVISHELRTPVTTILGSALILARAGAGQDEVARASMLEDVRAETERLHRLVEDLLVLSRAEHGPLLVEAEPLILSRTLDRVIERARQDSPTLRLDVDLAPDIPVVFGEVTYVEQALRNLLGNAAKYTPLGTRVSVTARQEGGHVAIRVLDDGPGISPGSEERLFDLFYRDPSSVRAISGSGIGLFVCARLVEAMGGRIWARRREEGGSEFGFTLPVAEVDDHDATGSA